MDGARHTDWFRCIPEQSWCKKPHQVLGSPKARSALEVNGSIDNGKNQTLRKEGNARINQVSAMRSGLAMIIEKYVLQDTLKLLKQTFLKQRMLVVLIMLTPGCRKEFIDC
jgi:hypothetical protein